MKSHSVHINHVFLLGYLFSFILYVVEMHLLEEPALGDNYFFTNESKKENRKRKKPLSSKI